MKILTLFTRFGNQKYVDTDVRLRADLAKTIPNVQRDFLIIDTALPPSYEEKDANGTPVIGSSNQYWEFGAWDQGFNYLGSRIFEYDYIHIVTSALYSGYGDFHQFWNLKILETLKDRAVAMGHLEVYNDPVSFYQFRFQAWLRSSYILAPPSEFKKLGSLVFFKKPEDIFSDNPEKPFKENAPVSQRYRSYIHSWLTGEGTGQGVQWHSRFDLSDENFAFYKNKAAAIFNEMTLSCRLKDQGVSLVDLTWLYRNISQLSETMIIPDWHSQLMHRGTGHEKIIEG